MLTQVERTSLPVTRYSGDALYDPQVTPRCVLYGLWSMEKQKKASSLTLPGKGDPPALQTDHLIRQD